MRKLIAVAVVLMLVSAPHYLSWPDAGGYFDRNILCQLLGDGDREIRMFDTAVESLCPRLSPAPHTYSNQNNCAVQCDAATIAAQLVETADATATAIRKRLELLLISEPH